MLKKIEDYFQKHSTYNAFVHIFVGAGIGVLVTYPLIGPHPLRWGFALLAVGILGHLYPLLGKK
ncbi:hypothetical protein HYT18_00245 [Candidatus Microgenomates bacterium]|nr:hypothetical protein [Candidatus Microgenomates bacterium]